MIYQVHYLDLETSEYDTYEVEANDSYQAECYFNKFIRDPLMVDIQVISPKEAKEG